MYEGVKRMREERIRKEKNEREREREYEQQCLRLFYVFVSVCRRITAPSIHRKKGTK